MEVHAAPVVGKRMWSYLRAIFFMARKGLLSNKRKLLVSMHLLLKRRNKAVERSIASLLQSHHHHHHAHGHALRRRDYEFSCSNSPDTAAAGFSASRRRLAYFPCLGAVAEDDQYGPPSLAADADASASNLARIEYYAAAAASSPAPSSPGGLLMRDELAPGEERDDYYCGAASPALLGAACDGAFSVRVSNYSSENDEAAGGAVDDDAEEFIRRFYEQLRRQNTIAMLPYMHEAISAA